ncbi:hypothetical protein GALL_469050 [mine drainage metagenome]|uniref:DUF2147 domain-containing protein n=1 Tax=mine drainage metagenome TaxID=410659 RepID=A0A1J5PIY8_9ZZZZ
MNAAQFRVRGLLVFCCAWVWATAQAQMTPVGNWHTFDDKTGELKGLVNISDSQGVLSGHTLKILRKNADPNALCTLCTDDRKDQMIQGMEIIRGARKVEGKDVWQDGKILDPENGKEYTLRLTPVDDGKKLEVRGSIAFFWRTQVWQRVP